jgi:hypothetical protein
MISKFWSLNPPNLPQLACEPTPKSNVSLFMALGIALPLWIIAANLVIDKILMFRKRDFIEVMFGFFLEYLRRQKSGFSNRIFNLFSKKQKTRQPKPNFKKQLEKIYENTDDEEFSDQSSVE